MRKEWQFATWTAEISRHPGWYSGRSIGGNQKITPWSKWQGCFVFTFRSAPELVARPCSVSPMTRSLFFSTKRLNSPTKATCLLTFPPSLRNSGYSSTNFFISDIELIAEGDWAKDRVWYDWTYDFKEVPRSPKVARWWPWKKGSVDVVRVTSYPRN